MALLFGSLGMAWIPYEFAGIAIVGAYTVFTLFAFITLPVEYDATKRALAWIDERNIVTGQEHEMASDALNAAARTYLVAALGSLAMLVYYAMAFLGNDQHILRICLPLPNNRQLGNFNSMNFEFTEEQLAVRDAAREFAQTELLPGVIERDEKQQFPAEQVKKMGELGFMGMMVDPKYGGGGMDGIGGCRTDIDTSRRWPHCCIASC